MPLLSLHGSPERRPLRLNSLDPSHPQGSRLLALGLYPGVKLSILQRRGPVLILAIGQGRLALAESLARSLMVELLA